MEPAAKAEGFSQHTDGRSLRDALLNSEKIPRGLRSLAEDDEIWRFYRPSGEEIDRLLAAFGPCGDGTKMLWLEALRLLKLFSEK